MYSNWSYSGQGLQGLLEKQTCLRWVRLPLSVDWIDLSRVVVNSPHRGQESSDLVSCISDRVLAKFSRRPPPQSRSVRAYTVIYWQFQLENALIGCILIPRPIVSGRPLWYKHIKSFPQVALSKVSPRPLLSPLSLYDHFGVVLSYYPKSILGHRYDLCYHICA